MSKTWRDYDKEITGWREFGEIEKFMIYVEYEGNVELSDEANDVLIDVAYQLKNDRDYSTSTGMGIAVLNALSHIADDCDLNFEEGNEVLSHVIVNSPLEDIIDYIDNAWMYGDWQ